MNVADNIRDAVSRALKALNIEVEAHDVHLEYPGELSHGDFTTNVAMKYFAGLRMEAKEQHELANARQAQISLQRGTHGKNASPSNKARELAEQIAAGLGEIAGVESVEVAGPGFINFKIAPHVFAEVIEDARATDAWGSGSRYAGEKVMVEYTDPNPFKEFHIGHLMSNAIGESVSRLLQFSGAEIKRANYQGDVGLHVAKAIWGKKKHPDLAWGKAYSTGSQAYEDAPEAKTEIDAINTLVYTQSDETVNLLYKEGRRSSLEHFEDIYKILGTKFDFYFFESETAQRGMDLVDAHIDVFEKSDGAIVYKGEKHGLHTRVFITSKGLPAYEAKDLGLLELKAETWAFDTSISITASEQKDYFRVVMAAMQDVLPKLAGKVRHVSHGMMRFAEGKMSSRKGNIVTGEALLQELIDIAKVRAAESRADNKAQLAQQIAVGAIKYQILKQTSGKDIIFDREHALSLEGDSGPYLQYAYARTNAILAKAKEAGVKAQINSSIVPNTVARLIPRFPDVVARAAEEMEPHLVATYLLELVSAFNRWYAEEQIVDGTPAAAHKVALVDAVRVTLRNGLWLLGIPAPEKM